MIAGIVASTRRGSSFAEWTLGNWVHFDYIGNTALRTEDGQLFPLEGSAGVESFKIAREPFGNWLAYPTRSGLLVTYPLYSIAEDPTSEPLDQIPADMVGSVSISHPYCYFTENPFSGDATLSVLDLDSGDVVHTESLPSFAHVLGGTGTTVYTVKKIENEFGFLVDELVEYDWQSGDIRLLRRDSDQAIAANHFIGIFEGWVWYRDDREGYRITRVNLETLDRQHLSLHYTDRYVFDGDFLYATGPAEDYSTDVTHVINARSMLKVEEIRIEGSANLHTVSSINPNTGQTLVVFHNEFDGDTPQFFYNESHFSWSPSRIPNLNGAVYAWSVDVNPALI